MTPATEAKVCLRSWIAAEENLVTVEVRSEDNAPITFTVETFADNKAKDYAAWASVTDDAIAQAVRQTRDTPGMKWVSRGALSTRVIGAPVETKGCSEAKVTQTFVLRPGATAQVVTCVSGGGRTGYAHAAQAARKLRALDAQAVARLEAAKAVWRKDMWERSYVETGDALLDRQYLSSIYLLASGYNRHSPACGGMYGVWNLNDRMNYRGDIHLNYNSQAGFYSVFSSNRPELALPYYDTLERLLPEGRRRAREELGEVDKSLEGKSVRGILFPVSAFGIGEFYCSYWKQTVDAAYNLPLYKWYYEYTGDVDFLATRAYPFFREVGDFYEDYLMREELPNGGHQYSIQTAAHEGTWNRNPATDLCFIELTFRSLLAYSRTLGVDAERRAKWQDIADHLPAYRVIQPTRKPNQGKPVFAKDENGWDMPSHVIQLHNVYPCETLHPRSPKEMRDIALNTLHYYGIDQGGFLRCMNEIGLGVFVMGARLGMAPETLLDNLRRLSARAGKNFLIADGHHCAEKTVLVESINSMMLQSTEGILTLFPNWVARPAAFRRLRAKGAFLVSADYDGRQVTRLRIQSERGTPCRLQTPWPGVRPTVREGDRVLPLTEPEPGIYAFETRPSGVYDILRGVPKR